MIEDPDVEVYVEARLDDKDRVEGIKVYVKSAEGTLIEYEDSIVIRTAEGNKFAFNIDSSTDIKVGDYDEEDLENGKADGKKVYLKFDDEGDVSELSDTK